ncbi:MAG: hypothetical protein D6E12_01085 [Desulfovibrio sp.]|nr:MAG: hypothetical protein D6E12_01085 [Desulfovibrio sp.]
MKRLIPVVALVLAFCVGIAWAADDVPYSQLMQNPLFANATPEIRLQMLNTKMEADELDVSSDLTVRLFWDVIVQQADPMERLKLFTQLEDQYDEFWASSDQSNYLLMEYLAGTEQAANLDFLGLMKIAYDLEEQGVISGSASRWTMQGFLALHLITDPAFQAMSPADKMVYLRGLNDQKLVLSDNTQGFSLSVFFEQIAGVAPEEREAFINANKDNVDGYTFSHALGGWINLDDVEPLLDPEVAAAATPQDKLAVLNAKIEAEVFDSFDLGEYPTSALIWEILAPIADPWERIQKYRELRDLYPNMPVTTDVEFTLVVDFMGGEPEAADKNVLGIIQRLQFMEDAEEISWHTVAPLHYGMVGMYTVVNPEYRAMSLMDRLAHLVNFDSQGWASSLTSSEYSEQVASEILAATPEAEKEAVLAQVLEIADFFTTSLIEDGYVD